jgi:succinate dehydrogenase / fumarate reductase cytochrome b subunit
MLGEIFLVFFVLYHGTNGLRIALFDLLPRLWTEERQRRAFAWVLGISLLLWLPAAYWMGRNLILVTFLGY